MTGLILSSQIHLVPDKTSLPQAIIFFIVLAVLSFFVFGPFKKIIAMRKDRIDRLIEDAKRLEEETKNLSVRYESQMSEINTLAHSEKEKIRRLGLDEETAIREHARKESGKLLEDARNEIKAAEDVARKSLKSDVPKFVQEIIDKIKG